MGYKNDQFFDNGQGEHANSKTASRNPAFKYPSRVVRGIDFQGKATQYELNRGYIRTLTDYASVSETAGANIPILKCNFQFNPEFITHSVPMRQNLTNVFLQSPAQMSQPIGGDVTFGFALRFDRSYELNNERDAYNEEELGTANENNIGVLADLRALYDVIGQGVSEEMINFQKMNAAMQAQAQIDLGLDSTDRKDYAAELTQNIDKYFNVNFGNSAFLIPMPVRVVFSSLFMVDGYVTSTEVVYTKFSQTLVPIQCEVAIQMQALYVGFAKDRTPVKMNLDDATNAAKKDQANIRANATTVLHYLEQNLTKIKVKVKTVAEQTVYTESDGKRSLRASIHAVDGLVIDNQFIDATFVVRTAKPADDKPWTSGVSVDAYQVIDLDFQESNDYKKRNSPVYTQTGATLQEFLKWAFSNYSISINVDVVVTTYGPYSKTDADAIAAWLKRLNTNAEDTTVSYYDTLKKKKVSEVRLQSPNITTYEVWENFRKGGEANATKTKYSKYDGNLLYALADQSDKYFIVATTGVVTPTVSGVTNGYFFANYDAEVHQVKKSGYDSKMSMSLDFTLFDPTKFHRV